MTYEDREERWAEYDEPEPARRRRRQLLTPWSALLFAIVLGGVGFLIGVRVEKSQLASSSSTPSSLASRFRSAGFPGRLAGGGGGFAAFGGGGGATAGTVSSVDGKTIYVTTTSGNTVKIRLSSATEITKSVSVGRAKVYPGDSIVANGVTGSKGTLSATTLTDSGARSTGAGSGSTGGSASSVGSAVSSLFGNGG